MLHELPVLDDLDVSICAQIDAERQVLDRAPVREWAHPLWAPRLWRLMFTNATTPAEVQPLVPDANAVALRAAKAAIDADAGYREGMSMALRLGDDEPFTYSLEILRQFHYIVCAYDESKQPGRLRRTSMAIRHETTGVAFYTAPEADAVPALMQQFTASLTEQERAGKLPAVVLAALAHLQLVSIHPFADANGRVSRCLQTLVLARAGFLSAAFCSLDRYYGEQAQLYCDVLGTAQKTSDPHIWLRFCLRGHLWQIARLRHRIASLQRLHEVLANAIAKAGLPFILMPLLLDAAVGRPLQPLDPTSATDISRLLASRHLDDAVRAGLLVAAGDRRDRVYGASATLHQRTQEASIPPFAFDDPYKGTDTEKMLLALTTSDAGFWKM